MFSLLWNAKGLRAGSHQQELCFKDRGDMAGFGGYGDVAGLTKYESGMAEERQAGYQTKRQGQAKVVSSASLV